MSHASPERNPESPIQDIKLQRAPEVLKLQSSRRVGGIRNWVRDKVKTTGAYVAIVGASFAGGQFAAGKVDKIARPALEAVSDATTLESCQGNFDEFKKEWLSKMENGQGKIMGKILDVGPVKSAIKNMIEMVVDMLNSLQEKLCKIPEAVKISTEFTAALAREITRAITMLAIFLALNALYKKIRKDLPQKLRDAADANALVAEDNAKAIQNVIQNLGAISNANMDTIAAAFKELTGNVNELRAENNELRALLSGKTGGNRDATQAISAEEIGRLVAAELTQAAGVMAPTAVQVPEKK